MHLGRLLYNSCAFDGRFRAKAKTCIGFPQNAKTPRTGKGYGSAVAPLAALQLSTTILRQATQNQRAFSHLSILRYDANFRPAKIGTLTRSAGERLSINDGRATQDDAHGPALDLKTFIGCVIGAVMQDVVGDGHLLRRIPEGNIGIRADRDRALLRIEAILLGMIGG